MPTFLTRRAIAIGEAMLVLAPVDGGLYRRGYAGDTLQHHLAHGAAPRAGRGRRLRLPRRP